LTGRPRIIDSNQGFGEHYQNLCAGDIICCRLRLRQGEEHLLLDLSARGVIGIPSFTSQLCSRSKAFQTRLFSPYMLPDTEVVYTLHDLTEVITGYGRNRRREVIVKLERKNSGLGVLKFASIEDVYSQSILGLLHFPFVLQPFFPALRDVRAIIIDDYVEAYERSNPDNFRSNLHCGGTAQPLELTDEQLGLCTLVMERGDFPYAHIDLMIDQNGDSYFSEINLRGGLRGARIDAGEYRQRIKTVEEQLCRWILEQELDEADPGKQA
jgi:ribosomal protein S6--L-glutamate ligase